MTATTNQIQLSTKQIEALQYLRNQHTVEVLFGGGAGGAKSRLGAYWLMKNCIEYPGSRWLMGRAVKKTLKETTVKTFWECVSEYKLRGSFKFRENSDQITHINGSEIMLKDLDLYPSDPEFDELGSLEITGAFIDEVNQVTKKAKNIVRSRIRYKLDQNNIIPKLLMACNPAKNWVYHDFYLPWKENRLDYDKKFVQALAIHNPFISKHYISNLRQLDNHSRERLLHGNWEYDDDPDALLSYDEIRDMFTNSHVTPRANKYLTVDTALMGSDRFIVKAWHDWIVIDHKVIPKSNGKDVENVCREFKKKHNIPNRHMIYDADGVGGFLGGYFPGAIAFNGGGKTFDDPENPKGYEDLKTQCGYKFAASKNKVWLKSIADDDTAKEMLTQELEQLKRRDSDQDGKLKIKRKKDIKSDIGRSPDFLDNCIMRAWFDLPKKPGLKVLNTN
jgi:hypothetical protein